MLTKESFSRSSVLLDLYLDPLQYPLNQFNNRARLLKYLDRQALKGLLSLNPAQLKIASNKSTIVSWTR